MSNTPGNSDGSPAVPVLVEASGSTVPLLDDAALEPVPDAARELAEAAQGFFENADVLAREANNARDAGDGRRADALVCAQAFRAEYEGDKEGAFGFWWSAFDHDPSLLVAFWGVRAALAARGDWQGVLGILERRIGALAPSEISRSDGGATKRSGEEARAEPWLAHGRILEDRLGRDEEAARSYRSGLIEAPTHAGLWLALAMLGWRRNDLAMIADALTGLLRGTLPAAARAEIAAVVARGERSQGQGSRGETDALAATRALGTLRDALRLVGPDENAPLIAELESLARATPDPLTRAEILNELCEQVPLGEAEVAVSLLRARARVLRDEAGDKQAAEVALRKALGLRPEHPLVLAELADLIEDKGDDGGGDRGARALTELLARVAPNDRRLLSGAEQQLALRLVTGLGRAGRAQEGIDFLGRHPELRAGSLDADVLEVALRAMSGDVPGLIAHFDAAAERSARDGNPTIAAEAHLVAGILRDRGPEPTASALASYEKAVASDPGSEIARDTLERHLRVTRNWRALAQEWEGRLTTSQDLSPLERHRILEDLTALERDELGDPLEAGRFQDHLIMPGDARSRVRRLYLALAAEAGLMTTNSPPTPVLLRELGELAGVSATQTALQVEAARIEAARGNQTEAERLFRATLSGDDSGLAASGLERLPGLDAGARAAVVRDELARLGTDAANAGRAVALRFRLAQHLCAAERPSDAIEELDPLRVEGNPMAVALAWEIARRSGNPELEMAVLEATPESGGADLQVPTDLAEAQEAAGELVAAADSFRAALRGTPSADAALGMFRVGAKRGDLALVIEASRALEPFVDGETKRHLIDDAEMLTVISSSLAPGTAASGPSAVPHAETGPAGDESHAVLRWASGITSREVISVSAGLLALARALPQGTTPDDNVDRDGLLARAAARARLGGVGLAGAVHDQAHALSGRALPIDVGLSDLPVAGRPERASARAARAERTGGRLGYALDLERGLDAESRGDAAGALQAFKAAAARVPNGIEALDGIRRVTLATGNRAAAARAGIRLGAILRTPHRAALEFKRAAALWQEQGHAHEAKVAYWQALARAPESTEVFTVLRDILRDDGGHAELERLLSLRLGVLKDPAARLPLLIERAFHRLDRLAMPEAAIEDFKRILKIDPDHPRSLRAMATLALDARQAQPAIRYLERLLKVEGDQGKRGQAWLELGEAYQAARNPRRAQAALREAVAARPDDRVARQRLVDSLLRTGDWSAALTALRVWEAAVMDPVQKAAIWIRIGGLLRDHGSVKKAAEPAFAMAADLDPLGDGVFELAELHAVLREPDERRRVLSEAVVDLRRALQTEPLNKPRLRRLRQLYQRLSDGPDATPIEILGAQIVGQVLTLLGEPNGIGGRRYLTPRADLGAAFWSRLRAPGAGGFAAEIWTKIAAGAGEMFLPADAALPPRDRVAPGTEPRLAWIEAAARALGLPDLDLALARPTDPPDDSVRSLETADPGLVVSRGALGGDAAVRFKVGRALAMLHEKSTVLERLSVSELATLFSAAAVVAGARPPADVTEALAEQARTLGRLMGRKNRKALELEVSRFGFETIDTVAFAVGTRATADRLGLLFCGDVEVAIGVLCGRTTGLTAELIAADELAMELLRFALSEEFLVLRIDAAAGEG